MLLFLGSNFIVSVLHVTAVSITTHRVAAVLCRGWLRVLGAEGGKKGGEEVRKLELTALA